MKAAGTIVLVFIIVGPPVGMAVAYPLYLMAFPVAYVVGFPYAAIAGLFDFVIVWMLFKNNLWPDLAKPQYSRGLGAVVGAVSGFLGLISPCVLTAVVRGHLSDVCLCFSAEQRHLEIAHGLYIASFAAGTFSGMISAPSAVKHLRGNSA
jgi:hypothetical protein